MNSITGPYEAHELDRQRQSDLRERTEYGSRLPLNLKGETWRLNADGTWTKVESQKARVA